jgi:coenzyme F420-reducing hydrogenase alpha subunit
MNTIIVDKQTLLKILADNRSKHVTEYEQAVEAYHEKTVETIRRVLAHAENREELDLKEIYNLEKPESHEKDYDLVIRMLNMDMEPKVTLSRQEYSQYVDDNWTWTASFKNSTSNYLSSRK